MSLRAARDLDAGALGAILSEWIDETEWMPRIHTRAEDIGFCAHMIQRGWVTVSETDRIAGFLARDGGQVQALYVSGAARGAGHGSALLAAAQAEAGALSLWTFAANRPAQAFYERHGFRVAERTDGQGNDEGLPDIRYVWEKSA